MADKKVCDYLGQKITIDASGVFKCVVGDEESTADTLKEVKALVKAKLKTRINVDAIYSGSGEMHRVKVVGLRDGFRGLFGVLASKRLGVGVPHDTEIEDLYPVNEHNIKVFDEHVKTRRRGWTLIHRADRMCSKLEPFGEEHFKKLLLDKNDG